MSFLNEKLIDQLITYIMKGTELVFSSANHISQVQETACEKPPWALNLPQMPYHLW